MRVFPMLAAGFTFCVVLCLAIGVTRAADIIALMQQRYTDLNAFSADFEQTLTHKESGVVEKRNGSLLFQKPLLIRWQTAQPHEEILVVTSKEIWDYLPEEGLVYRYPPDMVKDSRTIIQVLTGQAALTKDFDVKQEGRDGALTRLRLYPREPAPQMVETMLWSDTTSGYIRRAVIIDFYGNTNDVRFTSFNPDAHFKSTDFSFTPPKGVEMADHIGKKARGRELFK
ncbi:outer-membrane lipoprotein carrier protein [Deltaproteobacteria bacterium]|nr:outer-membrane lipoprotein carrier protein [Deltaproteobacteria bacterium]